MTAELQLADEFLLAGHMLRRQCDMFVSQG